MLMKICLFLGLMGKFVVEKLERILVFIINILCYIIMILKYEMRLFFMIRSCLCFEFKYGRICLIDEKFIFK